MSHCLTTVPLCQGCTQDPVTNLESPCMTPSVTAASATVWNPGGIPRAQEQQCFYSDWEGGSLPCREGSAGGILWGWALPPVSSSALGVVFMWLPSPLPVVAVESLSHVWFFTTPWTATHQASLSFNTFQSLLKLMSIESVMLSNHLILCHHLLLLSSIFPSIKVFSNESALHVKWPKYWSFSFGSTP